MLQRSVIDDKEMIAFCRCWVGVKQWGEAVKRREFLIS